MMFFFFKQKTAYEMRISDWSSDVCSSDLNRGPGMSNRARTVARSLASQVTRIAMESPMIPKTRSGHPMDPKVTAVNRRRTKAARTHQAKRIQGNQAEKNRRHRNRNTRHNRTTKTTSARPTPSKNGREDV